MQEVTPIRLLTSNGMLVLSSPVVMADWDFAKGGQVDEHCTVTSTAEVINLLKWRVSMHPEVWYLYKTFSGVHAFCGRIYPMDQARSILSTLKVDGYYIKIASVKGYFDVRVSPKANRQEKQLFMGTVGKGETSPLVNKFLTIHDSILRKNGLLD